MAEVTLSPGKRLKQCREQAHLSQGQLAEAVRNTRLGTVERNCNTKYISALENDRKAIGADYALLLAEVLNVDPAYLRGIKDFPTEQARIEAGRKDQADIGSAVQQAFSLYMDVLGITIDRADYIDSETDQYITAYIFTDREGNISRRVSQKQLIDFQFHLLHYAEFSLNELLGGM